MGRTLHCGLPRIRDLLGESESTKGNNGWIQLVVYCLGTSWRAAQPPGMTPSTVSPQSWRRSHHLWHGGHWHASRLCLNTATLPNISCTPPKMSGVLDVGLWHGKVIYICLSETSHPFRIHHGAMVRIPPHHVGCARKTSPIWVYFRFNHLLFHWPFCWIASSMFSVLAAYSHIEISKKYRKLRPFCLGMNTEMLRLYGKARKPSPWHVRW